MFYYQERIICCTLIFRIKYNTELFKRPLAVEENEFLSLLCLFGEAAAYCMCSNESKLNKLDMAG